MYPLPDIDDTYDASRDIPRGIFEEASIEANEDDVALSDTPNEEQRAAYDEIMSPVNTEDGVSSLWTVLTGPERLIYTEHFSLLYAVRKRLLYQQLHLVSRLPRRIDRALHIIGTQKNRVWPAPKTRECVIAFLW